MFNIFYIYFVCIFFIPQRIDLDFMSMHYIKIDIIIIIYACTNSVCDWGVCIWLLLGFPLWWINWFECTECHVWKCSSYSTDKAIREWVQKKGTLAKQHSRGLPCKSKEAWWPLVYREYTNLSCICCVFLSDIYQVDLCIIHTLTESFY